MVEVVRRFSNLVPPQWKGSHGYTNGSLSYVGDMTGMWRKELESSGGRLDEFDFERALKAMRDFSLKDRLSSFKGLPQEAVEFISDTYKEIYEYHDERLIHMLAELKLKYSADEKGPAAFLATTVEGELIMTYLREWKDKGKSLIENVTSQSNSHK